MLFAELIKLMVYLAQPKLLLCAQDFFTFSLLLSQTLADDFLL